MKKEEYRSLDSVDTIVFVDPDTERAMTSQRHGDDWVDTPFTASDIRLPAFDLIVPHAEIFARD